MAECLEGRPEAFRQIVERYQNLICSVAYCATGNLSQSEDMAQETFLTAWKQLRLLREPAKLRGWLCGIVRNRIQKNRDQQRREPLVNAAPLEEGNESPACEALPSEQTISREEELILWRSLEKIPELYREPLVLFYREHQSIEHVAQALELSEDAVKQRLSRGRKLLQEEVQAFVENTLRRTAPGQAFASAVLAAVPMLAGPAAAAGIGVKGTAAATKSGFLAGWLVPLAPFIGIAAGVVAQWLIIRDMTTDRRLRVKRLAAITVGWIVLMTLAVAGESSVRSLGQHFEWSSRARFVAMAGFWWLLSAFIQALTFAMVGLGGILGTARQKQQAGESVRLTAAPMERGKLALVVAGVHLALFSWMIRLAWLMDEKAAAATIAGTVVVLGIGAFRGVRGKTGAALAQAVSLHFGVCFLVLLTIINLRLDVWVASSYGVTVAEAHRLQPLWIVPLLTLALVLWAMLLAAIMKRKRRAAGVID